MRLLLKGWTFTQIAQFQERTPSHVAGDVKAIEKRWRESAVINFNEARQQQLSRIDLMEREAWAAWEGSKTPKTSTRHRKRQLPSISSQFMLDAEEAAERADGESRPTIERVELEDSERTDYRDPDPRFLQQVAWCIQERNKMMSLYPDKDEGRGAGDEAVRRLVVYLPPEIAQNNQSNGQTNGQSNTIALPAPAQVPSPEVPPSVNPNEFYDLDTGDDVWRP